MISAVYALLLTTTFQAEAVNTARNAYFDCLRGFMRTSLQQRTEPPAFQTAVSTQCAAEAETFRSSLVRHDARNGGTRSASENDFRLTREEAIQNMFDRYQVYFRNNQVPN